MDTPIGDHAILGDTRTAALVSRDGSIDWMCVPDFGGPPLFDRLVSGDTGGSFLLEVEGEVRARRYRDGSAVLETTLAGPAGTGTRTEGMVVDVQAALLPQLLLVRHVRCETGSLSLRVRFDPRLGLPARAPTRAVRSGATVCTWGALAVSLQCAPTLTFSDDAEARLTLTAGEALTTVMTLADRGPLVFVPSPHALRLLEDTHAWWRRWSRDVAVGWPARDAVVRSLITLRLLTFAPSGAPVAAPTTSLPEEIGGSRNWDYRFSWVRDASIGVGAYLALGKGATADAYMGWLLHASRLTRPRLQVLYTVYGTPSTDEREVGEAPGHDGSRPVRVGNSAATQHQLDVYGWLLFAAWSMVRAGRPLQRETWRALYGYADHVCAVWDRPDSGIWEFRGRARHYVHSKLMAWVGLGCALQLAAVRRTRSARQARWSATRTAIADAIREHGLDPESSAYGQSFGSADPDAALLLLPVFGFDETDPRVRATLERLRRELEVAPGLVHRYRPGTDGLPGGEGAFLPCSFWLVEALVRTGQRDAARAVFDEVVGHANEVGLLSEELDPVSGRHLGNFPLSFTHASLILAAASLRDAEVA